jgi:hypothetical protein
LHQHELTLEAGWIVVMEWAERQLSTLTRANQNVAVAVVLLDMLPIPSTDEVGEVYQRLNSILGTITV